MPIKKRSKRPALPDEPKVENSPLKIEAKPKRPLPPGGAVEGVYGASPCPSAPVLRRLGPLALDCGDDPDADLNATDRVKLMRTPYDEKNPQEVRYRNRVRGRGTAITAMCVICQGGRKAVTECVDTSCPLWSFRFGNDPFYGKKRK